MELMIRKIGRYNILKFRDGDEKVNLTDKDEFELLINDKLDLETPHIIFDFTHIKNINSDIIGSIINLLQKVLRRRGSISFVNINDEFKNLLVTTKLLTFFNIFESENQIPVKYDYSIYDMASLN